MKRSAIASLLIALVFGIFPLPLAAAAQAAASAPIESLSAESHNWSGYVATGTGFSSIAADWVVPSATSSTQAGDAAWIGIGGMQSTDLIQTGTRALAGSSGASYGAWYETLPAAAMPIAMTISAGDTMQASLAEIAPDEWSISLEDSSNGEKFSTTLSYHSTGSSVEWIEEAPQSAGALLPLDHFSPVAFSAASATDAGTSETPAALGATRVSLVSQSLVPLATPSVLSASGNAFSVARD